MATYWHCTPRVRTPTILREGLRIGSDPIFGESDPRFLYLTGDANAALGVGQWLRYMHKEVMDILIDVLRIKADLEVEIDPNEQIGRNMRGEWLRTTQNIAARAIVKVYPLERLLWSFPQDRWHMCVSFGGEEGTRIIPKATMPPCKPVPGGRRIFQLA
jgi:hypothetical protein